MRGTTHPIDCPYWPSCHYTCWAWEAMQAHMLSVHPEKKPRLVTEAEMDARRERIKKYDF